MPILSDWQMAGYLAQLGFLFKWTISLTSGAKGIKRHCHLRVELAQHQCSLFNNEEKFKMEDEKNGIQIDYLVCVNYDYPRFSYFLPIPTTGRAVFEDDRDTATCFHMRRDMAKLILEH